MARNDRGELYDLSDMGDDEVRSLILRELRDQPNIDADDIDVVVKDGAVRLTGRVGTDAEAGIAENILTDVIGIETLHNEVMVDSTRRGQRAEGADEAAMEEAELGHEAGGDTRQQSDTAAHLVENLEEEQWGTHDPQAAIQDGTAYTPPDNPTPDGYEHGERH
jgi:hypothetical protein